MLFSPQVFTKFTTDADVYVWKSKVISSWEFHKLLKKPYCTGLVMPCFHYMNLKYSTNFLASLIFSLKHFLLAVAACFFMQIYCFFNFYRERLCLQTLGMRINIHVGPLCRDDVIKWKKNHSGETGFLICKSEISVVKNIPPSQGRIISRCNQKCIF